MISYDLMLVDGYNVINHWQTAGMLKSGELDYLREQLVSILSNFAGYWQVPCIIVFDAHHVRHGIGLEEQINQWVEVVFTAEGQSADSWIERYSSELSNSGQQVVVISSDWMEQTIILGHGSYRMSVRDFLSRVKQTKQLIDSDCIRYPGVAQRSWLADNLPAGVRSHLEQLGRLKQIEPLKRKKTE